MNRVAAWYIDCEDPDNGMPYRSVTFNADDVTSLHVPLYASPDTHCVVSRGSIKALRDEVRDQASLKDHYQDWGEFELMVEAMLNAAEVGDE